MKSFARFALTVGASTLFAGCNASQPPSAMPQSSTVVTTLAGRGGSWISHEAKSGTLLYASDFRGRVVWVYSYPAGNQVGELKGFPAEPAGLCSDASGNIFVTMQGNGESQNESYIYEYAHGGSSPIATLTDPGYANGCAVDPTSGNLAVANRSGPSGTSGDVAVYQDAQGSPTTYSDPNLSQFLWCTYDDAGNLFADDVGAVDELPKGADELSEIKLSTDINTGSIQWVHGRLVIAEDVGFRGPNPIYKVRVFGSTGSVSGPILLSSRHDKPAGGTVQFWVQRNTIIGPGHRPGLNGLLNFWKYPKGGLPRKVIKPRNKRAFFGVTISVAAD
jgi:hypothetical protein